MASALTAASSMDASSKKTCANSLVAWSAKTGIIWTKVPANPAHPQFQAALNAVHTISALSVPANT